MESNDIIKSQIIKVVKSQIKAGNPPETTLTLSRLKQLGYNEHDATMLIGQCLLVEIFNGMKHKEPYNEQRYLKNLKNLPEEPFED